MSWGARSRACRGLSCLSQWVCPDRRYAGYSGLVYDSLKRMLLRDPRFIPYVLRELLCGRPGCTLERRFHLVLLQQLSGITHLNRVARCHVRSPWCG